MLDAPDGPALVEDELAADRLGPSLWGTVYRARDGQRCYRLLPQSLNLPAATWAELQAWTSLPSTPQVAPVVHVDQREVAGAWHRVVTYDCGPGRSLGEIVAGPDPAAAVEAVVATVGALPAWWDQVGHGFLPLPSDVVVGEHGPRLLRAPPWGVPPVAELFTAPERIDFLAPEILRGGPPDGGTDLFCLGVAALRCFAEPPGDATDRLLHQRATGAGLAPDRRESRLPAWLDQVEAVQRALDAVHALLSPASASRRTVDPTGLATALAACLPVMDPVTAIRSLREAGRSSEGLELAQAVLLAGHDYEVLLLAADIAWKDLRDPLEALTLLDSAVRTDAARREAYVQQIAVIGDLRTDVIGQLALAIDGSFADRLDRTIEVAFDRLSPADRDQRAGDVAAYLVDRGQPAGANRLLHRMLHDGQTLKWWRFDLVLLYGETFVHLDRLDDATGVVELVKWGLRRVRANQEMPEREIVEHGNAVTRLELRIHELRYHQGGSAP